MMKKNNLKDLLSPWILNAPNKKIQNLILDSRTLTSKDVFLAVQGEKYHGNQFICEAIKKNVVSIISETLIYKEHGQINYINDIPLIYFFQLSKNLSYLSSRFYNNPGKKLKIIGVTGTNGKTTITQLINQWHTLFKKKVATIGTLGHGFYPKLTPSKNTTPSAIDIQSFLYLALKKKR